MVKDEICFKAGVMYMSKNIQEMIAHGDNIRKIEEKNRSNSKRKEVCGDSKLYYPTDYPTACDGLFVWGN